MNKIDSFRSAVNKHFAFLCQRGFADPKESNHGVWDCFLEYSSVTVSIMVCYGPPEFHAELCFWRISTPEIRFGPGDLLVVGQHPESWNAEIGTTGIEKEISWLASAIHTVEEPLCSGDITFYEILTSARHARLADWNREEKLRLVHGKVEDAWKKKNWVEVVSLYNSIRNDLSLLEEKRLSYAQNKLKS